MVKTRVGARGRESPVTFVVPTTWIESSNTKGTRKFDSQKDRGEREREKKKKKKKREEKRREEKRRERREEKRREEKRREEKKRRREERERERDIAETLLNRPPEAFAAPVPEVVAPVVGPCVMC